MPASNTAELETFETAWIKHIGGSGRETGQAIALNGSHILLTGSTQTNLSGQLNSGQRDVFISQYDDQGAEIWTKLFGGSSNEWVESICTDSDGNILIAGFTSGSIGDQSNHSSRSSSDAFIAKFNSQGEPLWVRLQGTVDIDYGYAVISDHEGAAYLAGSFRGSSLDNQANASRYGNPLEDVFITKYSASGNKLWTSSLASSQRDIPLAIAISDEGYLYAAGYSEGTFEGEENQGSNDIFLSKLDLNGNKLWTKLFGGSNDDRATAISIDGDDAIYLTGFTWSTNLEGETNQGGRDAFLLKLNLDGQLEWARLLGSDQDDYGTGITLSEFENLRIC